MLRASKTTNECTTFRFYSKTQFYYIWPSKEAAGSGDNAFRIRFIRFWRVEKATKGIWPEDDGITADAVNSAILQSPNVSYIIADCPNPAVTQKTEHSIIVKSLSLSFLTSSNKDYYWFPYECVRSSAATPIHSFIGAQTQFVHIQCRAYPSIKRTPIYNFGMLSDK